MTNWLDAAKRLDVPARGDMDARILRVHDRRRVRDRRRVVAAGLATAVLAMVVAVVLIAGERPITQDVARVVHRQPRVQETPSTVAGEPSRSVTPRDPDPDPDPAPADPSPNDPPVPPSPTRSHPTSRPAQTHAPSGAALVRVAPIEPAAPGWRELASVGDYAAAWTELSTHATDAIDAMVDLLAAGDVARLSGHADAAVGYLSRALAAHPSDPRAPLAAFTLGRVHLEDLGAPRAAAQAFARAYELGSDGPLAEDALAREVEA